MQVGIKGEKKFTVNQGSAGMQCRQRSGIRVCHPDDDRSHREHRCRQCSQ